MSKTLTAVIRDGKIEAVEQVDLPERSKVLVTLLPDEEAEFWLGTSQISITQFGLTEDDVYVSSSKHDVISVRYPFSDLTGAKVNQAPRREAM